MSDMSDTPRDTDPTTDDPDPRDARPAAARGDSGDSGGKDFSPTEDTDTLASSTKGSGKQFAAGVTDDLDAEQVAESGKGFSPSVGDPEAEHPEGGDAGAGTQFAPGRRGLSDGEQPPSAGPDDR